MNQIDLIIWDLETTGFVAPEAKILEIGAMIYREGQEVETKQWVFKNEGLVIPEEITALTGINQAIIDREGRDPKECLQEFIPMLLEAKQNVTHNGLFFDIPFLTNTLKDVTKIETSTTMAIVSAIRDRAFDTAVFVKASKLNMPRREDEVFLSWANRVMNVRAYGVKFNLTLCSQEYGIDTSKVNFHRALGDVYVTGELYKKIINK